MFLITCFFIEDFGVVNAATNSEHEVIINTENVVEGVKEPIEFFIVRKISEKIPTINLILAIILILTIILIVGLIMLLNKKFSSKLRKAGVALIVAILIALIILIVDLATNQGGVSLWLEIFKILKILIVSIILIIGLIGLIMCFNKKSSDRVKKIGLALIIIAVVLAVIALAIYRYIYMLSRSIMEYYYG